MRYLNCKERPPVGWMAAALLGGLFALACNGRTAKTQADGQAGDGAAAGKAGAKITRISLPERSFDFGDVNRGEVATHTFVVKNVSKEIVHIQQAQGS